MNKKIILILIPIIILGIFLVLSLKGGSKKNTSKDSSKNTEQTTSSKDKNNDNFLLDDYPIEKVPLYKLSKVSSNKIFVNTDPKNTSAFNETNFAYYNVVFYSDASQEEFLNYYKNLFDSQFIEEFTTPDMVKGNIGQYKVTAAHYGSDNTGYLQVHLSSYVDESINKYFVDFPEFVKINPSIVEHEKSSGLLNQKGGEIEYTKYFTVLDSGDADKDGKDDVDEFISLETEYQKQYQQKTEYSYDAKTGMMNWKDGGYEISMSLSRDHGRIYLMIRKKIGQ